VTDEEYVEPTNAQLASFLVVYAKSDPRMQGLNLSPPVLESLLSQNPRYREAALRQHRQFQAQIHEVSRKLDAGELQCEHILRSGKKCPNRNEPGIPYCGLHKEEYGGEDDQDSPRSLE
jgi:hypothetical protein